MRLNRTFYGIETINTVKPDRVLSGLNRTFYGIETADRRHLNPPRNVLIVPFMELKQTKGRERKRKPKVLIVPFMGIETVRSPRAVHQPCRLNRTIKTSQYRRGVRVVEEFQFHKRYD